MSNIPNRRIMPKFGPKSKLKLVNPSLATLDNGTKVFIFNDPTLDFLRFDYITSAGSASQTKPIIAECALNLLNEGSTKFNGNEITSKIEFYGTHYEPNLTKDNASVSVYSLSKNFKHILPLLSEIIKNPLYEDITVKNYLARKKQKFISDNEKIRTLAMRKFNEYIFGNDSAYGRIPIPDDYDNIQSSELHDFHKVYYFTQNNYIILSGKVRKSDLKLLNSHFGDYKLNGSKITNDIKYNDIYKRGNHIIEKQDSMQSAIRIGKPIFSKSNPDYPSFFVLNTLLGGYFGSRLMTNLREKNGYTYGINSFIINFSHANYWSIGTQVNADNTNDAIGEINNEIKNLQEHLVSDVELNLVKNYIYGSYLRSFDGPLSQAERFRANYDLNLDFEEYKSTLNKMMTTSSSDIQEMANKYLNTEDMLYLVVGKDSK